MTLLSYYLYVLPVSQVETRMTSRLGVIFDRVSQNTETKEITTPVKRKGSTFKSQCGTQSQNQQNCLKRGKTRASKSRLVGV